MTQTCLSPIHFLLYKILRNIKSDFTFNHKGGLEYLKNAQGSRVFSVDLSAATDRVPRDLEARFLEALFNLRGANGSKLAEC